MNSPVHDRFSRVSALAPARRREPLPERELHDSDLLMPLVRAEVGRNRYGEHLFARQWYATPEMCEPDPRALRLLLPAFAPRLTRRVASKDSSSDSVRIAAVAAERALAQASDPSKWLFLDTETTGLAGGTGTYAFLVGLAWWDGGGVAVEQLFMRDHSEEHSVLLEIARRVQERPVLVTFNGKSFDWPLLDTRFRMTRSIATPVLAAHLDMLHPARQLWRLKLGSVRLAELEDRVLGAASLGWSRSGDIDSSRIPEFYFHYLRGGPAEPLAGVFRHNSWDLRGLAALAGRIFRALAEPDTIEPGADGALELYGVSRLLCRRGERVQARTLYERALGAGLPQTVDRTARHELARLAKRERDFVRAAELWTELTDDSGPSFEACEQLAIHHERRAGNSREAARLARFALEELRRARRLGLITQQRYAYFSVRFEQRLARLTAKLDEPRQSPISTRVRDRGAFVDA